MDANKLEKIVSWAKRRGFIFPSSEIYGGLGGDYDFGPYGIQLKNNIKREWKVYEQERNFADCKMFCSTWCKKNTIDWR